MHSRGDVADMATFAHADVRRRSRGRGHRRAARRGRRRAERAASRATGSSLDPGIGFAKRSAHSLAVLRELARLVALGYPVLVGVSRKRFIGEITGVAEPSDRVARDDRRERRGARAWRAALPRARREAARARRSTSRGRSCAARDARMSILRAAAPAAPRLARRARDRDRELRDLPRAAAHPPHARDAGARRDRRARGGVRRRVRAAARR